MIFVCFVIAVLGLMIAPLFPTRDLLTNYSGDLTLAYLYMGASLVFFSLCYYANSLVVPHAKRSHAAHAVVQQPPLTVKNSYLLLIAAWSVFGTMCSMWQIAATTGISAYLDLIRQGGNLAEVARTSSIMLKASEGGLPGYIKMWNQNATAAVLLLIFFLIEGRKIRGFRSYFLVGVITLSFVVRNFVHMDRLALLAIIPAIFELWLLGSGRTRYFVVVLLLFVGALAEVQSIRRGHGFGSMEFLILYLQFGVFNHNLLIDTFKGMHTFGASTIFSPFTWILQGIGHPLPEYFHFAYVWDLAQDLFGYLFIDFGWYGILFCGLFGFCAQYFDAEVKKKLRKRHPWAEAARGRLRPFIAYAALSSMFVPAIVGPEFWLTALTLVAFTWLEFHAGRSLFVLKLTTVTRSDDFVEPGQPAEADPVMVMPEWSV